MRKKQQGAAPPLISGSSLLVIFAILCLTTFALLSLSTVQAHLRQMRQLSAAVTDYYAADCKAEETLALLRSGLPAPGADLGGLNGYTYTVAVNDTQELQVAVTVTDDAYRVDRWQVVPAGEWTPEDELFVWDGELPGLPLD